MSTEPKNDFDAIDPAALETVAGGAARGSSKGGDAELTALLTNITSSIKDLASSNKNQTDPMQLMLMMLVMGGFGGGGGGAIAAPVAAPTPVINVDTAVAGGGCRRRGKKGW
jgi:hypothetical protein